MKKQKNFMLDDDTIQYIVDFKNSHSEIQTEAAALRKIIEEHRHKDDLAPTKYLIDALAKQVAKELKDTLTRIRLGVNNADRNSDIILMLLNSQISYSGYKTLIEKETQQLKQARQIEKDRIAHYRQKKLDKSEPNTNATPEEPQLILDEDLLM